jgi:hypothetical protein
MDRDVEAVPDGRRHAGPRGGLVLRAPALHEVQDVVSALVGALGSARPRQEPGDPYRVSPGPGSWVNIRTLWA